MKIAVVTLPLHTNYGGILQAYALQHTLVQMGNTATMARFSKGPAYRIYHPFVVWLKQKGLMSYRHNYPLTAREHRIVRQNTSQFIDSHIRQTLPVSGRRLSRMGFDAFVVGSDQVWRHYDTRYFLDFVPAGSKVLRIAYAPSFGTEKWPFMPDQTDKVRELAVRFDALSAREDSGVELCRERLGMDVELMPDPTILPGREHWESLASGFTGERCPAVMSYILDRTATKNAIVEKVCATLSLTENSVMPEASPGRKTDIRKCIWPPVEQWLAGFADAEFVVTDSFHGTVFALLFNKPFIAICNDGRGAARFHSLLGLFGLGNRLVNDEDEISAKLIRERIDFAKVNGIMEEQRRRALLFLENALS